jgi:hypothetical protein
MSKSKEPIKPQSKLLKKTIELYENRPISITNEIISEKTGLGYPWICGFRNSEEVGVVKIETLYKFLSGKELEV